MTSEEKNDTYEETVSRTTSEPSTEATIAEEKRIVRTTTATPNENVETYEASTRTAAEDDDEAISAKAKEAGRSLKELVYSLGKKTKAVTEEKARELKTQSLDVSATSDARDIQHLGSNIENLLSVFEDTMTEIRKEPYDEQERLLVGYSKLLEEQIKVIDARLAMARRLKPGA